MELAFHFAKATSIGLFLFYGLLCLFADGMVDEFERYGLSRYRRLTGALEVLGAAGLLVGYASPTLDVVSAGGLAVLMVLGLAVRIRVRDSVVQMLPAAFLLVVNAFIVVRASGWWT